MSAKATGRVDRMAAVRGLALEVVGLRAAYDTSVVLQGVDLTVEAGSCVAVLGPNGAGKTTLMNAIAGIHRPVDGTIRLAGQKIDTWPAHRVAGVGVCYVPEGRGIFPDLTVRENLNISLGRDDARRNAFFDAFPLIRDFTQREAGTLSGGEQQILAMAPAVAGTSGLILIDELSLGLAPLLVDQLFETLVDIRARGASVLLVEQFADRALHLADRVYVLRKGTVVFEGEADDLRGKTDLLHALYLGTELGNGHC